MLADALLHELLDRIEETPLEERARPVQARLPAANLSGSERQAATDALLHVERLGGVNLVWGKGELRHLIQSIRLTDPTILYRHLGRKPAGVAAVELASTLVARLGPQAMPETLGTVEWLRDGWARKRTPFTVPPSEEEAFRFLRALNTVLARRPGERSDLRTFSSRMAMDSKLIEREVPRIIAWMISQGRLPPDLPADEAQAALGLEKFAHPVLVAGQASLRGMLFSGLSYVGVAPDDVEALDVLPEARVLLSIENFASFCRHVAEAMTGHEVVVYTGGFPSRIALRALRRLSGLMGGQLVHWGDVDGGGYRIACHLAHEVCPTMRLHLMDTATAIALGRPTDPDLGLPAAPHGNMELEALRVFLGHEKAYQMEQEVLDPHRIGAAQQAPLAKWSGAYKASRSLDAS